MYGLSNDENIFDLRWPLKVKGQGQTPKNRTCLNFCWPWPAKIQACSYIQYNFGKHRLSSFVKALPKKAWFGPLLWPDMKLILNLNMPLTVAYTCTWTIIIITQDIMYYTYHYYTFLIVLPRLIRLLLNSVIYLNARKYGNMQTSINYFLSCNALKISLNLSQTPKFFIS